MKVPESEIDRRVEHFTAAARRAGLKLTHQRLQIFRAVAASLEHPSAEAVYREVRTTTPTVSLDTVYRTLWTLTDLGVLTTLGPRQDSMRFDANVANHHHYVCTRCGLVRDFESDDLDALEVPDTARRYGQVVSAHIEVRGICDDCVRAAASEEPDTRNQRGRRP
ncbi:MAG: Fur family transcriptional regulator [Polyangiales bacterium]|nr:transcriptional repressor [Myxococcales bacterium]MCB9658076.1 transcriptional repressor [Sandaracinaceae bacterium]